MGRCAAAAKACGDTGITGLVAKPLSLNLSQFVGDHIGATVEGDEVEVSVTITAVEGRAVSFEATVKDSLEEVGRGVHNRFVVDVQKTYERLTEKRKKVMGS